MGLTRPRYSNIPDSDFKNSCRVVTTTNLSLTGGAPNTYDGVTLVLNDRILVTGQLTGSQNGLYYVTTLGSGSNGTWSRTFDASDATRLNAGAVVSVSEGTYAGTLWHLLTPDPITVGTTALSWSTSLGAASGANTQVQFNKTGSLFGASSLTFDDTASAPVLTVGGNVVAGNVKASIGFTMGSQVFYAQGTNGFSVNENFDPSNNSGQTAYHFTSGATRANIAFTLARTGQFTDGFGVYGTSADNTFVTFGEQSNTSFEWRTGIGIQPLNLSGGTQLMKLSSAGNLVIPTATASTSTGSGALIVPNGGVAIVGNLNLGSDANIAANLIVGTTSSAVGNVFIRHTTPSTTTATGALQVVGGAGIGGNVYVGGNIYINNAVVSTMITNMMFSLAF